MYTWLSSIGMFNTGMAQAFAIAKMQQGHTNRHPILGPIPFQCPDELNPLIAEFYNYVKDTAAGTIKPLPLIEFDETSDGKYVQGGQFANQEMYFTVTWTTMLWHIWFGVERTGSFTVHAMAKYNQMDFKYRYSVFLAKRKVELDQRSRLFLQDPTVTPAFPCIEQFSNLTN